MDDKNLEYLGDGVYVRFNGYSFEISVNDHRNPPVVMMEDEVIDALVAFKEKCLKSL